MEPEQGQLAPLQGQAAAAAATVDSGEGGILPDFRRQLGVILQTVGKAQVEKMLRELVREQEQQGRVRRRKRVARSPGHGGKMCIAGAKGYGGLSGCNPKLCCNRLAGQHCFQRSWE